ncbi:hypothetical protein M2321_001402 [Rhodoblastus acidophilus]|nr:hypothetical protein [Rhodoblastus acidophilus]
MRGTLALASIPPTHPYAPKCQRFEICESPSPLPSPRKRGEGEQTSQDCSTTETAPLYAPHALRQRSTTPPRPHPGRTRGLRRRQWRPAKLRANPPAPALPRAGLPRPPLPARRTRAKNKKQNSAPNPRHGAVPSPRVRGEGEGDSGVDLDPSEAPIPSKPADFFERASPPALSPHAGRGRANVARLLPRPAPPRATLAFFGTPHPHLDAVFFGAFFTGAERAFLRKIYLRLKPTREN